jgi:hypothetical protein
MSSLVVDLLELEKGSGTGSGQGLSIHDSLAGEALIRANVMNNLERPMTSVNFQGGTGAGVQLTDVSRSRGAIATPHVPAASTAQQVQDSSSKSVWRDCMIFVTGGTGVEVRIDGQDTGLAAGSFLVPSGKTFNLGPYTAAPTLQAVAI